MKAIGVIIVVVLILSGCQEPNPIELRDSQDDSRFIEVMAIGEDADSLYTSYGIDTSGLFNSRYYAKMYFSNVYYSLQSRSDSFMQAEAIFLDRARPIEWKGHKLGYASIDVGTLMLESDTLPILPHKLKIGPTGDTVVGYKYRLKKQNASGPREEYSWRGSGNMGLGIGNFNKTGTSAPSIRVTNINPTFIPQIGPLNLKWKCSNSYVNIFISHEGNEIQRTWVPILFLRIRNVKGEIQIPEKVLNMLPMKRYQRFLFTLSSEVQNITTVDGYNDDVLLHSASIHNILLNVGP